MKKLLLISALCSLSAISLASSDSPYMQVCFDFDSDHDVTFFSSDYQTSKVLFSYTGHGTYCTDNKKDPSLNNIDNTNAPSDFIYDDGKNIAMCSGVIAGPKVTVSYYGKDTNPSCSVHREP